MEKIPAPASKEDSWLRAVLKNTSPNTKVQIAWCKFNRALQTYQQGSQSDTGTLMEALALVILPAQPQDLSQRDRLVEAAEKGDVAFLKKACDNGADLNRPDGKGQFSFHAAVKAGQWEVMSFLMEQKCYPLYRNANGAMPSDLTAEIDPTKQTAFKFSLQGFCQTWEGVDFGAKLIEAAAKGASEEIGELASRGPVDAYDMFGETALHKAARQGDSAVLRELIQAGADVNARSVASGAPPIHFAFEGDNWECVSLLIQAGADLTMEDYKGRTLEMLDAELKTAVEQLKVRLEPRELFGKGNAILAMQSSSDEEVPPSWDSKDERSRQLHAWQPDNLLEDSEDEVIPETPPQATLRCHEPAPGPDPSSDDLFSDPVSDWTSSHQSTAGEHQARTAPRADTRLFLGRNDSSRPAMQKKQPAPFQGGASWSPRRRVERSDDAHGESEGYNGDTLTPTQPKSGEGSQSPSSQPPWYFPLQLLSSNPFDLTPTPTQPKDVEDKPTRSSRFSPGPAQELIQKSSTSSYTPSSTEGNDY